MHKTEFITPLIRKMAVITVAITLMASVEQVPSFAASESKTGQALATVKSEDGAVIRNSYSIFSKKKMVLKKNESFVVSSVRYAKKKSTSKKNIWYYSPTLKGYIRSDLASISYPAKGSGKTTGKTALRKGAGTKFKKIKTLKKSTKLTVYISGSDYKGKKWLKVKAGKVSGFVKSSDVKLGNKVKTANATGPSSVTGFPASYTPVLNKLKAAHPNWEFKAVNTGLDWNKALNKMTKNPGANTTYYTFGKAYRYTGKGYYNYLKDSYVPKDGNRFYAASKNCVAYYMDPRNFLDEYHMFMFEDHSYHSNYQTLLTVQGIFKGRNNTLFKNAKHFITAGKKYDISPVYLATKALGEQGSGINSGKVGGKKVYNVFNIGAYDSASGGAVNGVKYAAGSGSYQRPWTSVEKAINGGAQYLSENFSSKKQNSGYLEHFNVLNGLSNVGTHVYMTAVYAPSSNSVITYNNYKSYGVLSNKFVFYIPVYNDMPAKPCPKPKDGKVDNNFYLKELKVKSGDTTKKLIKSSALKYSTSFTVNLTGGDENAEIIAKAASKTKATIKGAGTKTLKSGTNIFKVTCTSSSGEKRTYTIKIVR